MNARRVNYRAWLRRLITWDGILPFLVFLVPAIVQLVFPNHRVAIEIAAVTLPITAFLLRIVVAKRHINSNHCTKLVRRVQTAALYVAILVLLMVDALVILAHIMPKGALFATDTDRMVWVVLIALYLTCMAIAMYPGRTEPSVDDWGEFDRFGDLAPPRRMSDG